MKFINEETEAVIRNNIQNYAKELISEKSGVADYISSVAKEVGARVAAYNHDLNTAVANNNLRRAKTVANDVLMHHYAANLGIKSAHLRTIMNDYPKNAPTRPSKVVITSSGSSLNNPTYGLELRDYETKMKSFKERQRVISQIKGLHKSIPVLGQLAKQADFSIQGAKRFREEGDPMVNRDLTQVTPSWVSTSGTRVIKGPGIKKVTKERRQRRSDVLKQYADAVRKRRKLRFPNL
jgi:hypothetical protein